MVRRLGFQEGGNKGRRPTNGPATSAGAVPVAINPSLEIKNFPSLREMVRRSPRSFSKTVFSGNSLFLEFGGVLIFASDFRRVEKLHFKYFVGKTFSQKGFIHYYPFNKVCDTYWYVNRISELSTSGTTFRELNYFFLITSC